MIELHSVNVMIGSVAQTVEAGQRAADWFKTPRNSGCVAAATGGGSVMGGGVGMLGLAGGPAVGLTEPAGMMIGGSIGWMAGMVTCMSASESSGSGSEASSEDPPDTRKPPVKATKLKGSQGWRDENGNIWKKDMLHKDHWDVSDRQATK